MAKDIFDKPGTKDERPAFKPFFERSSAPNAFGPLALRLLPAIALGGILFVISL